MSHACPICQQAGLPDYRIDHVICPQCNSDLKAYLLLNNIANSNSGTKKRSKPIVLILLILVSVGAAAFIIKNKNDQTKVITENKNAIDLLKDSISYYKKE